MRADVRKFKQETQTVMERMDRVKSRNISQNRNGQTAKDIAQRAEADRQRRGKEAGQRYVADP